MRGVLALAVLLAALPAAALPKNPDTFIHLGISDAETLDPAWCYDTASANPIANMYEYLLAFKGSSMTEMEGRLSEKAPSRANGLVSADGLTYTFPIRKGVRFHDATPLTPEDVRYSLLRFMLFDRDGGPSALLLEPVLGRPSVRKEGKPLPGVFETLDKAVTVRGGSVVIRLPRPFAPFLTILTGFGAIVSKDWTAKHGGWDGSASTWQRFSNPKREDAALHKNVNGTGPFTLERWDQKSKLLQLKRFDGYWRGPAKLKRVIVRTVDEFTTRKLMLQAGDADAIYAPLMLFPQVAEIPGVTVIDGLQNLERGTMLLFTFQMAAAANPNIGSGKLDGEGIPPDFFSDKDVRKAFAHALDYESYIKEIVRGKARRARGIIPKGLLGYDPKAALRAFDLKKAAEHLKRAWKGQAWEKGFRLTIVFAAGSAPSQTIAQMLKKNLESLSPKIAIDARPVAWSSFIDQNEQHKIPVYVGAWQADYPDPHNFAFPLAHSAGYFPAKQGYKNPQADALVEAAVSELDEKKRAALYVELQALLFEDLPHAQVAEGARFRTQRSWVKGYKFSPVFPDSPYGSYYYDLSKE